VQNTYCHFISVLQHLHTSPLLHTLTKNAYKNIVNPENGYLIPEVLDDLIYNGSIFDIMLVPVALYAHLTDNSQADVVYRNVERFITRFATDCAADCVYGYVPQKLLAIYFLPSIFVRFRDHFGKIMEELYFDSTTLETSE
jgi:hypothetical protein